MPAFPPQPLHGTEVDRLASVFASVVSGREAVYVSTPITTGRRLSGLGTIDKEHPEYEHRYKNVVRDPNRQAARGVVDDLRRTAGRVVIDPSSLADIPGWTQDDYLTFWGSVIERFVERVIFVDGWQFSRGCVFEFYLATTAGIPTYSSERQPLRRHDGMALIDEAIAEFADSAIDATFFRQVRAAIAGEGRSSAAQR
jgi:hypothetical protein